MGKNKKQKLTPNEKLTLVFSSIAIFLALIQLIFSVPIFSDYVYSPNIIGKLDKREYDNGKIRFIYKVENNGNKTAENLILNFSCFKNDSVTVMPNLNLKITKRANGIPLKDIIIETDSFVSGDCLFIIVETDSIKYNKSDFKDIFPFIGQIKYKDGFGKTIK
ncbi:MAG: hypothetical protein ACN6OI_15990 [Flavobacterium sp.]|jgi:hypothetical protein|uniref:hypothetical protein n=1 Tax=Flavobacterium sp. TaxID=239 RepID=UPI003D09C714